MPTHRRRMCCALAREPVDRLPTQIDTTGGMREELAHHLGVPPSGLDRRLDNHLLCLDLSYPRRTSADGRIAYDWWGWGGTPCGGISAQTVLPHGTPAEVQAAVAQCVQVLAGDGTGLAVAPSHRMMADLPMENVDALRAAFGSFAGP